MTAIDRLTLLDELRAIAQTGLHYSTDPYDRERCTRLLALATEGYSEALDLPEREVRDRLARDLGYVSAKVGTYEDELLEVKLEPLATGVTELRLINSWKGAAMSEAEVEAFEAGWSQWLELLIAGVEPVRTEEP